MNARVIEACRRRDGLGRPLLRQGLTPKERAGVGAIVGHLFPVKWKSPKTPEGSIDKWEFTEDEAHALLDGGKTGEVKLKRFAGMTAEPVVIKNLRYCRRRTWRPRPRPSSHADRARLRHGPGRDALRGHAAWEAL
jgi:hypothetical protein